MVTYAQLQDIKPSELQEAADGWHKVSSAAGEAMDRVNNQITAAMRKELAGEGCEAALNRLERLSENFQYVQTECGLVRSELDDLARDLAAAKKKLDGAVTDARKAGYTVGSDGSVKWTTEDGEDAAAKERGAQGFAERIGDAVSEASEADSAKSGVLAKLKARNDLDVTAADWADAGEDMSAVRESVGGDVSAEDIPEGKSPAENAAWWSGLSKEQRADYLSLHPAAVGALDGLPAEVRDGANRTVLAEKEGAYQQELDNYPPEPVKDIPGPRSGTTDEWQEWYDRKQHLEASLEGMGEIQDRFDATGESGLPEAYLLGFDPEKDGRAIVANGNPDTADHTAVYVPGTTTDLSGSSGSIGRTTDLWRESQVMADGEQVSTISWLGYDAPDDVVRDAPFSHYADDGAPALNTFMDGLDTSHDPSYDSHTTVVSHSYGTTLVGSAARQGDLNADDVVFAGSPGVQVGSASEMDVPEGHVWNQEAENDPVPNIGQFGHGPVDWSWTGPDWITPSDEEFGAHQMSTDTDGHSAYWTPGSETLRNQAAVVTGQYDHVAYE